MIQEIEGINETDEKVRIHLARKEKTGEILRMNRTGLDKSLNNMEDYLANTKTMGRTMSPGFRNTRNSSG